MKLIIKRCLPDFIKPAIRFIYYQNERKKIFREILIRRKQNKLIRQFYADHYENLIVFIVDGANWFSGKDNISGGILSIASIYEESKKLKEIHHAEVMMVTHADAHLLLKHTQFPNNIHVFRFNQIFNYFKKLDNVLFHVPEYIVPDFSQQLFRYKRKLLHIKIKNINILNQNVYLMPEVAEINFLKSLVNKVTQTTAHEKYSTPEIAEHFGIPLFKLSVFSDKKRYFRKTFHEKKNILAVSPDEHPLKEKLLQQIKMAMPNWKICIIINMKYTDYLTLISQCKFMLTFGEGLDFYFIETIFSGGISFTYYNTTFFPESFKNTIGIFENAEKLESTIIASMKKYDNEHNYSKANNSQEELISTIYKHDEYLQNLRHFYNINFNN